MATHAKQASTTSGGATDSQAKRGGKKSSLFRPDAAATINSPGFQLPVIANGLKDYEQYIDKTMVNGKQRYSCKLPDCVYSSFRSDSMARHMRQHTGDRPYKCQFCTYASIQSSALKIHMRRHTGEKPYMCKMDNCGKQFAVHGSLAIHERTHTGLKRYECNFAGCNYSGNERARLVTHSMKCHGIDLGHQPSEPPRVKSGGHQIRQLQQQQSYNSSRGQASGPSGGESGGSASTSIHSLALVNGSMSPTATAPSSSVMMPSVYNPFMTSGHHGIPNHGNTFKPAVHSTAPAFPGSRNYLSSFLGGAANYDPHQSKR